MTGKNSPLMHAASSLVLNAVKMLANIPERIHLLPTNGDPRRSAISKRMCSKARSPAWTWRRR